MATKLAINERLLEEALRIGGRETKKATVTQALREYIDRHRQTEITKLFGKIDFSSRYDYKRQRHRK